MEHKSSNNSIGFFGLLQVIFITLKVLNLIDWSWWMVFSPTWISLLIVILAVIVLIILDRKW